MDMFTARTPIIPTILILASAGLTGCSPAPGSNEFLHVYNDTSEPVRLYWHSGKPDPTATPYQTIEPGKMADTGIDKKCPAGVAIAAITESGVKYKYGPPVCADATWRIGKKE
ncbi:hypothetical protein LDL08_04445 [Nonomuraea glycinis]|uniref:Lipoprotein n=1 Tax=Nonomuraea glycinis TaxID=2047744 RepID=A0A918A2B2_9ACTN|nr:hypothetical protein [Nonomuraea glycinis]MCA2175428.1 hypothetical protein [Nonomuraea glycinis]GGP04703.1 hypothetical protein GCM10012278_20940 [Nonomuraea glycinis]